MGLSSKNRVVTAGVTAAARQQGKLPPLGAPAPTSYSTPAYTQTPLPQTQATPSFQFAPQITPPQAYVTPLREQGSGTGAQNAFASQQPVGYDPVANFLAQYAPQAPVAAAPAAPVQRAPRAAKGLPAPFTPRGVNILEAILKG
jgi:hypothetical protein